MLNLFTSVEEIFHGIDMGIDLFNTKYPDDSLLLTTQTILTLLQSGDMPSRFHWDLLPLLVSLLSLRSIYEIGSTNWITIPL